MPSCASWWHLYIIVTATCVSLTHWGRVTHICVGKLTIIGSDNGLSPDRRQAIIWTNDGILLIGPLGTKLQWNFNRNSNIFIQENALENVVCEMASILCRPQCVNRDNYPGYTSSFLPKPSSVNQVAVAIIVIPGITCPVWTVHMHMDSVMSILTHWGRVTHICVGNLTIIASHNGLPPARRQAIISTNTRILLIRSLGTNFSEISIGIQTFSVKKMHLNMSSAKWCPFCLGRNVLKAPGAKTPTGALLFYAGATILWQFANPLGVLLLGRELLIGTIRHSNFSIMADILHPLKFVPIGATDKKPPLVWVIAWHWTVDKPLPESLWQS